MTLLQVFFQHFASKNQLPDLSLYGRKWVKHLLDFSPLEFCYTKIGGFKACLPENVFKITLFMNYQVQDARKLLFEKLLKLT